MFPIIATMLQAVNYIFSLKELVLMGGSFYLGLYVETNGKDALLNIEQSGIDNLKQIIAGNEEAVEAQIVGSIEAEILPNVMVLLDEIK